MDRLTQMQTSIDNLVLIIYSSFNFILDKSQFKEVNEDIQITHSNPNELSKNDMNNSLYELTTDLVRQSNQLKLLIDHLPSNNSQQVQSNNEEYLSIINQSAALNQDIKNYLDHSV